MQSAATARRALTSEAGRTALFQHTNLAWAQLEINNGRTVATIGGAADWAVMGGSVGGVNGSCSSQQAADGESEAAVAVYTNMLFDDRQNRG